MKKPFIAFTAMLDLIKSKLYKLMQYWHTLSRPLRVLLLIILMCIQVPLIYIYQGCPPLSDEHRYRRVEKAHLVGPAEILDVLDLAPINEFPYYDKLLLAKDKQGVIMYIWSTQYEHRENLVYRKTTGDVAVFAAPYVNDSPGYWFSQKEITLPVILFDDIPQAIRAELEVTLSGTLNRETFTKTYELEATRNKPGYFCFLLHADSSYQLGGEGLAMSLFASYTYHFGSLGADTLTTIPATVRLYDSNDKLIYEETLTIQSLQREALEKRGDLQ
ncbi:MAG: hypothetical protein J6A45_06480 [Lachnospiraceae bacterium]|nr:hypothetical protein [Lachnospiraceae bacterium]